MHDGVRYQELRGGKGRGLPQNGGYIEAVDEASGRELWLVKIYDIAYDKDIEDDKREVYIVRLRIDRARRQLLVENERGERYALDLKSRNVEALRR